MPPARRNPNPDTPLEAPVSTARFVPPIDPNNHVEFETARRADVAIIAARLGLDTPEVAYRPEAPLRPTAWLESGSATVWVSRGVTHGTDTGVHDLDLIRAVAGAEHPGSLRERAVAGTIAVAHVRRDIPAAVARAVDETERRLGRVMSRAEKARNPWLWTRADIDVARAHSGRQCSCTGTIPGRSRSVIDVEPDAEVLARAQSPMGRRAPAWEGGDARRAVHRTESEYAALASLISTDVCARLGIESMGWAVVDDALGVVVRDDVLCFSIRLRHQPAATIHSLAGTTLAFHREHRGAWMGFARTRTGALAGALTPAIVAAAAVRGFGAPAPLLALPAVYSAGAWGWWRFVDPARRARAAQQRSDVRAAHAGINGAYYEAMAKTSSATPGASEPGGWLSPRLGWRDAASLMRGHFMRTCTCDEEPTSPCRTPGRS